MKIYQSSNTWDERSLPSGTSAYKLKIKSARLCKKAFGEEDGLFLELKKPSEEETEYPFKLVGKKIHEEFLSDMHVRGVEELAGKEVLGYIQGDKPHYLRGLRVPD